MDYELPDSDKIVRRILLYKCLVFFSFFRYNKSDNNAFCTQKCTAGGRMDYELPDSGRNGESVYEPYAFH